MILRYLKDGMCSNTLNLHPNEKLILAPLSESQLYKGSVWNKTLTYLNINDNPVLLEKCHDGNHSVNGVSNKISIEIYKEGIIEVQRHAIISDQVVKGSSVSPFPGFNLSIILFEKCA